MHGISGFSAEYADDKKKLNLLIAGLVAFTWERRRLAGT
jgi:hypothetical protein